MKPTAARRCITSGRAKASDKKRVSGYRNRISAMNHSQKGNGLVWGLSTRKTRTPWRAQNSATSSRASHSDRHSSHSKSSG